MIRHRSSHGHTAPGRIGLADDAGTSAARILIVDGNHDRARSYRDAFEIAAYPEPERAVSGDDALDILGATAQRFDVVVAWAPLADSHKIDFAGILRRSRSPVRLMIVTEQSPRDYPTPGRLAGACAIEGRSGERGVIRTLRTVLRKGPSVADIVATLRVPAIMDQAWALAIYGVSPGARLQSTLD